MVVTHPTSGYQLNIGLDVVAVPDLRQALESAELSGCDFLISPLIHPRYERALCSEPSPLSSPLPRAKRPFHANGTGGDFDDAIHRTADEGPPPIIREDPLTRSDLELSSGEWQSGVVAKLSPWIRPDSVEESLRLVSEKAFMEEVAYAAHISLRALVIPTPSGGAKGVANLARCISSALVAVPGLQLWLRMPVKDPPSMVPPISFDGDEAEVPLPSAKEMDPWEIWNTIRSLCGSHPNLHLALELTPTLPQKSELERWTAEPVRVVLLGTNLYVTNRVGYPVLSKRHQDFIKQMFKYRPFFALTGRPQKVKGGEGYRPFVQYLAHLFGKMPSATEAESFEAPYYDYLQAPLQPLANNLESQTYETFEKDAVKYAKYEEAIRKCLAQRTFESRPVIAVVGAGRGPLVRCSLAAAKAVEIEVDVIAVEKNPNAVNTLRNLKMSQKWTNVRIISSDMRTLPDSMAGMADVLVSELLGSFGDNELSPECLAGACKLLKKGGVSIPSSYTSFLAPLASSKLHNEVKAYGDNVSAMETAYVVRIHRAMLLADPKPVFTFRHPNQPDHVDNSRYAKLQYFVEESNVCHGFAGYFEAVLYENVILSIRPETHSEGMFSWFPLYFPLHNPVVCEKGSTITVHMWRRFSASSVHYEWCTTSPSVTAIHNPDGRSYSIGLGS